MTNHNNVKHRKNQLPNDCCNRMRSKVEMYSMHVCKHRKHSRFMYSNYTKRALAVLD